MMLEGEAFGSYRLWFLLLANGLGFAVMEFVLAANILGQVNMDAQEITSLLRLGVVPIVAGICIAILSNKNTKSLFARYEEDREQPDALTTGMARDLDP